MIRHSRSLLILGLIFAGPAFATSVTYQFSGRITETIATGNELDGLVSTSSTFTGRFTYDSENYSLSIPSTIHAFYHHYIDFGANFSLSLQIDGNLNFIRNSAGITVADNEPISASWGGDSYYIESTNLRGTPGSVPEVWDLPYTDQSWWLQFRFMSLSDDVFDGFALTAPLLMDEMIVKEIRISAGQLSSYGWLMGDGYQITGVIDHIQVVPIPAAAWLFGGALGCLGWIRRREY